jgi:membrane protease YdiL (CAAX protease family)
LLAEQPQLVPPFRVFAVWSLTYLFANICGQVVISVLGYAGAEVFPTWVLALSALTLWGPYIGVLIWVSRRNGSGSFVHDFSLRFQAKDLWGVPLGVACQLLLVVLVTLPFQWLFPSLFNKEVVEKRANDLFDAAQGAWIVLLFVVVVMCAPIVEEIVYRGFIQHNFAVAYGARISLLLASFWFASVHLQLAEFPGLFAFALVLGLCFSRTKRLGLPIVTHVSFNATALTVMALTR